VVLLFGQRSLPVSLRPRLTTWFGARFGALWRFSRWIAVAAIASTSFSASTSCYSAHFRPAAESGLYGAALALLAKFEVVQNAVLTSRFPRRAGCRAKADLRAYVLRTLRLTGLATLGFLLLLPLQARSSPSSTARPMRAPRFPS